MALTLLRRVVEDVSREPNLERNSPDFRKSPFFSPDRDRSGIGENSSTET